MQHHSTGSVLIPFEADDPTMVNGYHELRDKRASNEKMFPYSEF
jgi:hypothetical protein